MIPISSSHGIPPPAFLPNADVCKYLGDLTDLIPLLEQALIDFSRKNAKSASDESVLLNPVRTTLVPNAGSFFMAMPVYYQKPEVFTCKLVSSVTPRSSISEGRKQGPVLTAVLALFDTLTGAPLAFMEAEELTAFRTAVVSFLSCKYLTNHQPENVAIIGTGSQAASHIQVMASLLRPKVIYVWGREHSKCVEFCSRWRAICAAKSVEIVPTESVEKACEQAEFIITSTSSSVPVLPRNAVTSHCRLITIVGAPTKNAQEAESKVLHDCVALYADSKEAASSESGDVINSGREIYAELGEIISGDKKLHECEASSAGHYAVFKSQGLAVEDAVSARYVYDRYANSANKSA